MQTTELPLIPANLPANITGTFNIALTETKFQALADEASKLVFNEDNLANIKSFIDKTRQVEKAIEAVHKNGKAEALQIGRNWDSAKNAFLAQVSAIVNAPSVAYTKLCQAITLRQQQEERERQRIEAIKNGIETNAVSFAKHIADCTTSAQLTRLESTINLETSRKEKYQEFLPQAVERFKQLNSILANQKVVVKEMEAIAEQEAQAAKEQNDALMLQLREQREARELQVEENKIAVQEKAIQQTMEAPSVETARPIFPTFKARRTTWKYEMVNEKEVMKKAPELLVVSLNDDLVKLTLKSLKDNNILEGKTEHIVNGIRYYEEKTF